MKITSDMDIKALSELMGEEIPQEEAEQMRDLLVASGYEDTRDISPYHWQQMIYDIG